MVERLKATEAVSADNVVAHSDEEESQLRIDLVRAELASQEPEEDDIPEGMEGFYYL